jgi:hypothetical protein
VRSSNTISLIALFGATLALFGGVPSCAIDDRELRLADAATDATAVDEAASGAVDAGEDANDGSNDAASMALPDGPINATPQPNGVTCGATSDCVSGICADGVCCNTACTDACEACNVGGSEGTCSPVTAGASPLSGHQSCNGLAQATCGHDGTCDGTGLCRNWGTQTVCAPSTCNSQTNTGVGPSTCNGNGNCIAPAALTCAPFACQDTTVCGSTCTGTSTGCSAGNVCNAGSCGLKVTGSACTANGDCVSNVCADKVCCATACSGQCQACDVASHVGTCTTLTSGPPHGTRAACTTDGTVCGGSCTGASATACTYPQATTGCRGQTCASGTLSLAADCNAAGTCSASAKQSCTVPANGSAICSGNGCGIACDGYHQVSGSSCVPKWTAERVTTSGSLAGVFGTSATDVYAVDYQHIYHSTGSGVWTTSYTAPAIGPTFDAIWADVNKPLNVIAVGPIGTIVTSSDGGQTWVQQTDPNAAQGGNYFAVTGNGSGSEFAYAVGNDTAYLGGSGWISLAETTANSLYAVYATNLPFFFFAGDNSGNIYMSTEGALSNVYSTGWSAVYGMWGPPLANGPIYAVGTGGGIVAASCTSTGGNTSCNWGAAAQTSNTTQTLTSVYGAQIGTTGTYTYFAVGANGTILSSSGNGTWTAQTSNTTAYLTGVWASSSTNVFVSGSDGNVMHLKGP